MLLKPGKHTVVKKTVLDACLNNGISLNSKHLAGMTKLAPTTLKIAHRIKNRT